MSGHELPHPPVEGASRSPATEVAVLVSDVVGSTKVSLRQGDDAYYRLVMSHHRLVRGRLRELGGVEFSEGGDSLLAWFATSTLALECAVGLQLDTIADDAVPGLAIKVGVAGGSSLMSAGRPYGSVVSRAVRLSAVAGPGQVIVDEFVLARTGAFVGGYTVSDVELRDLGRLTVGLLGPGIGERRSPDGSPSPGLVADGVRLG